MMPFIDDLLLPEEDAASFSQREVADHRSARGLGLLPTETYLGGNKRGSLTRDECSITGMDAGVTWPV